MKERTSLQNRRAWTQGSFFVLFVVAPPLDLLRFDLHLGHGILFGQPWTLGLEALQQGAMGPGEAAAHLVLRGFLPLLLVGGGLLFIAWRYGRLYCGWLCPHFSVVELINGLLRRASGKPSVWESKPLPERLPDGRILRPDRWYWIPTLLAVFGFAFLWALTLLTYLLPPAGVYHHLLAGTLSRGQGLFLGVATSVLSLEFLLARHLFCRFGCAVGLFQSLVWMGNPRAMVVHFDTPRARACQTCQNVCDHACPMRLPPRARKRRKLACTQCGECLAACTQVQFPSRQPSLLRWTRGEEGLLSVDRTLPSRPEMAAAPALKPLSEPPA
jgi:polyferredoxin